MTCRKHFSILFALLCLLSSLLLHAQKEQTYQYKRKVFLVELQVAVFDKDGNFVEGLKPEDFIILDEGKQQQISHFDYVVHNKQNVDLISQRTPAQRRHFLLLFDLSFTRKKGLTIRGLANGRKAGLNFINMILPTDQVAIVTYSSFQGIKVLADFTNDKNQLKDAINSLGIKKATQLNESLFDFFEDIPLSEDIAKATEELLIINCIDQLQSLAESLKAIGGKKNIIYLSDGFDSRVLIAKPDDKNIAAMFNKNMDKMLKRFVDSDCVIYSIDVGGLRVPNIGDSIEKINPTPNIIEINTNGASSSFNLNDPGKTTLFFMANETGGEFYHNMNDFSKALDDILESTSKYYVIGYYPAEVGKEGKFHKVKVKVNRPSLKVVTRKGYYEDKPYKEYSNLEKKMHLAEVVIKDIIHNDIQFTAFPSVFPGREKIAQVPIFLQFPGKQFLINKEKKQVNLEIHGYLMDDKGAFKDFFSAEGLIDIENSRKILESRGLRFYDMLLSTPSKHKVKLIVQDSDTGELGSKIYHIMVPDYESKELTISPALFVERDLKWLFSRGYDPENPEGKKKGLPVSYPFTFGKREYVPSVVPEFKAGQAVQFCLKVYNLTIHPETKTNMKLEIIDSEGDTYQVQEISLLGRYSNWEDKLLELLFQFKIDEQLPGQYQLKVTFADILARKAEESFAPFMVKP